MPVEMQTVVRKAQVVAHPNTTAAGPNPTPQYGVVCHVQPSATDALWSFVSSDPVSLIGSEAVVVDSSSLTIGIQSARISIEYQAVGEALGQLVHSDLDDDWRIDDQVYQSACTVAAQLIARAIPAPRVFAHGSRAVVFNWTSGTENRYITISKDTLSVLVSTPEKIQRRCEYKMSRILKEGSDIALMAAAVEQRPLLFKLLGSGMSSESQERIL